MVLQEEGWVGSFREWNMAHTFTLREMTVADGPAINTLAALCPDGGFFSVYSQFRENACTSLQAIHPDTVGVVAEASDHTGLAGMGQASFDVCRVEGKVLPCALLNTLMVHPACRRKGLGRSLTEWQVQKARSRFGGNGIIMVDIQRENKASHRLHARWSEQMLPPVAVVLVHPLNRLVEDVPGLHVGPVPPGDLEAFADGLNRFYETYAFFKPETSESLLAWLEERPLAMSIHHCLSVRDGQGNLLAGLTLDEAYRLRTYHVLVPRPMTQAVDNVRHSATTERVIRQVFAHRIWFGPGCLEAARYLWENVRRQWHGKGISLMALFDDRSPVASVIYPEPGSVKTQMNTLVKSPVPIPEDRLIYPVF